MCEETEALNNPMDNPIDLQAGIERLKRMQRVCADDTMSWNPYADADRAYHDKQQHDAIATISHSSISQPIMA